MLVKETNTENISTKITNPVFAGGYQIGGDNGLYVWFKNKPIWLHRVMCHLLLGFVWVDSNKVTNEN